MAKLRLWPCLWPLRPTPLWPKCGSPLSPLRKRSLSLSASGAIVRRGVSQASSDFHEPVLGVGIVPWMPASPAAAGSRLGWIGLG